MKSLVILLLIAFTVQAQKPKPCATPRVFESKSALFFPEKKLSIFSKFSYDGEGKRIRVAEEINMAEKKTFVDVISLYKEKVMYVIQIKINPEGKITRTCTKHPLTTPFKESAVPADATYLSQVYLGTGAVPGAGLLVDLFVGKIKNGTYRVTVTHNLCIPVSQEVELPRFGHVYQSFFDVVLGIIDPARFVPPPECKEAKLRPLHPMKAKHIPKGFLV